MHTLLIVQRFDFPVNYFSRTELTGKHLRHCPSKTSYLQPIKKETLTQVFSSKFSKTFDNSFFIERLWSAAFKNCFFNCCDILPNLKFQIKSKIEKVEYHKRKFPDILCTGIWI